MSNSIYPDNKVSVHIDSYGWGSLPKFISVKELSEVSGVSEDRIIELANAKCMPHARIDGGSPVFIKKHALQWIRENLIGIIDGEPIPFHLYLLKDPEPITSENVPKELKALYGKLIRYQDVFIPPCVYFLVRKNKVVYVGQSTSLPLRINWHKKDGKNFDTVYYMQVPETALLDVESNFIAQLKPFYNSEQSIQNSINKK